MIGYNSNKTGVGSEIPFSIKLELPDGLTMDDIEFSVRFQAYLSKYVSIDKSEMTRISENEYVAIVSTSEIGEGRIKYEISIDMPGKEGNRKEIIKGYTEESTI